MKLPVAAAIAALVLSGAASAAPADFATLTVDASRAVGQLKPLRGVNGVPDLSFADVSQLKADRARPGDVSAAYREARINLVRTHDSLGVGDVDPNAGPLPKFGGPPGSESSDDLVIFPNPAADPQDPKSYNFGPTDRMLNGIAAINAEVIFRLGRGGSTTAEPPTDLAKYGEIIRHIVLHYNKGWANGFQNRVKYWEVWNEPDLGKVFWRGTPAQYYALYGAAARAVRAADPKAWVGGPTITNDNVPGPYRDGFLDYVKANKLPLDFFSWHYYSIDANDPQDFVRISRTMRKLLDERGYTATRSVLDEWNYGFGFGGRTATPAHLAAFVTSSIIYMQDAPIDEQALYRADALFGADAKTPNKTGQALIALGRMERTNQRLQVTGADLNGLAVQAGRSRDGRVVQVLISNYQIPAKDIGPRKGPDMLSIPGFMELSLLPRRTVTYGANRGYDLAVKGLRASGNYLVERYRISDTHDFKLLDSTHQRGPVLHLEGELPPPGIELLVVTAGR